MTAAEIEELYELLDDLAEDSPCRFDRHGYCRDHHWLADGPCPHARAQELLKRKQEKSGGGEVGVAVGNVYMDSEFGQPVITRADPIAGFSLEVINDGGWVKAQGDLIKLGDLVVYRAIDFREGLLIGELVEDRRNKEKEGE